MIQVAEQSQERTREDLPYGPIEKLIRCKRCNAAFWQDADE